MLLITILFLATLRRWYDLMQIVNPVTDRFGDLVLEEVEE